MRCSWTENQQNIQILKNLLTCNVKDKELFTWQSSGGIINSIGHVWLSQWDCVALMKKTFRSKILVANVLMKGNIEELCCSSYKIRNLQAATWIIIQWSLKQGTGANLLRELPNKIHHTFFFFGYLFIIYQ